MFAALGLSDQGSDEPRKRAVWAKAHIIPGQDADLWRSDAFGSVIRYSDYGDPSSEYGWEIDHYAIPRGCGGIDMLPNSRPLHWRNNAVHGGSLRRVRVARRIAARR